MYDGAAAEELGAIATAVQKFVTRSIARRARLSETTMSAGDLSAILDEARASGIVATDEPSGLALWEDGEGDAARRSVDVLARLAEANAGVALAAHLISLARWLLRQLGIEGVGPGIVALHGRHGLGGASLARLFAGADPSDENRAILEDVYAPDGERLLTTGDGFPWVLMPELERGALRWALHRREDLEIRRHPHAHGFDELMTISLRPRRGGTRLASPLDAEASLACFAGALARMSLGLVAIALGAGRRAHRLARDYAAVRVQGGVTIDHHDAVGLLLSSSRAGLAATEAQLEAVAHDPLGREQLLRVVTMRAVAHQVVCRGANDALQVFGGAGYMRESGLERVVRDENHLRVTCGSPWELSLMVAEWERLGG